MKTKSICLIEVDDGEILGVTTFLKTCAGRAATKKEFIRIGKQQESDGERNGETLTPRFTLDEIDEGWREKRLWGGDDEDFWSLHVVESL